MAKLGFGDMNIHIFPSHGLALEPNLSGQTYLLSIPGTEVHWEEWGHVQGRLCLPSWPNILLSGSTVSPEGGIPRPCSQRLVKSGRMGCTARCLGTGFPSLSQRAPRCSPGRKEKQTFVLHGVWTLAREGTRAQSGFLCVMCEETLTSPRLC